MKETILALLETKFQGVRKDGLNQLAGAIVLQVSTDEEANTVVGRLTAESVHSFIADWRKEADAEIEKANHTRETNLRKKYDFVEKGADDKTPPVQVPAGTLDAAAIQDIVTKAVTAATQPLQTEIATLKGSAATANRRELLVKELADVPESYKNRILKDFDRAPFPDEDSFSKYLDDTKTDVAAFKQELADKGLSENSKPMFGKANQDGVSAGVENYIKATTDEGKGLGGKDV